MTLRLRFKNPFLFIALFCILSVSVSAQEVRSYDGSNNNLDHSDWGASGTNQLRVTDVAYSDQISQPAGLTRPNPRYISNTIFNQDNIVSDGLEMSDFAFVWGQFIDHDITLVLDSHFDFLPIPVPEGDPYFDPFNAGDKMIPLFRSAYDLSTGSSIDNPREFPNRISSFIDGSNVYGSSEERADWLRTFEDGKLKMSEGDLLPYNTLNGELLGTIDPDAPEMANANPTIDKWYVAGDVRANENALLTTFHTIFAREHNRLCDEIIVEHPEWNDEQVYQRGRRIVGGLIQAIVYEGWLPTLGLNLGNYSSYNPNVNPGIMNVFSVAAYRYGHTVINSEIKRMDNDGNTVPEGNVLLRDAFFNPSAIAEVGGIDPYLIGMATQVEQDLDCKLIHDLRNFLFGAPGDGGMDLAAINIQRGRERGLPDYNSIRETFGFDKKATFEEISNDEWFNDVFENVYGSIDNIDAWPGLLAEEHVSGTLFGETVMTILTQQFNALRVGDRFYYENDPAFSDEDIEWIKKTSLRDIVLRNTDVQFLQHNVFYMAPHQVTGVSHRDDSQLELAVFPNPVTNNLFVNLSLPNAGEVLIQVSDVKGGVNKEVIFDAQEGMNTFEFSIDENLPSGIYLITLIMDNKVGHKRVFKD